ncbi:MAG TPA: FAD-dependent oxidoreductase [Terrimesophilobacter sp.]|nr:FAD-dependent oxidoreductase [Terrimesophilobacter sp.]
MRVAVVGGGLLGSVVALFAAARGWDVELIDARSSLLSGASCTNEGKVHLGPIFALGDSATQEVMLRGALSFGPLLEDATGSAIDWGAMCSPAFDYIVMPSSLLEASELAVRYSSMNARFDSLYGELGCRYLGRNIDFLVDPEPREDPSTGLGMFASTERAVDPVALCALLTAQIAATPRIATRLSRRVHSLENGRSGVDVSWQGSDGGQDSDRYDFAVNCTWESQLTLSPDAGPGGRNFRVKTAVRLPRGAGERAVTLAQGPFGDVVSHHDYTYVSWYPDARLTNEFGAAPSADAFRLLNRVSARDGDDAEAVGWRADLARRQIAALQRLRLLPDSVDRGELIGGIIVGHGARDIDQLESQLHNRAEFGTHVAGRLITPRNFKLTTAPLAALRAIDAIDTAVAGTVLV